LTARIAKLKVLQKGGGVVFWIHVTPRAHQPSVGGLHGDALRIAVRAPALEGRANRACARALAEALEVRPRDVDMDLAARGRRKRVEVTGECEQLVRRLGALAERSPLG
jgi:uncharacterized protein (TIGR00251 family)